MILGRSPALWLALVAAALNVAVVVFSVPLSDVQVLALNGLAFAFIGVVANESDPRTVPTLAPTLEDRRVAGPTPGTDPSPTPDPVPPTPQPDPPAGGG